jgi:hypothetical protein
LLVVFGGDVLADRFSHQVAGAAVLLSGQGVHALAQFSPHRGDTGQKPAGGLVDAMSLVGGSRCGGVVVMGHKPGRRKLVVL